MLIHIIDAPRKLRTPVDSQRYEVARGHWFPVVLALSDLEALGIAVEFHDDFSTRALDCDLAIVASRHHDFIFKTEHSAAERVASVARLAERCRIAWFDLRDSSGTPQFEVLPLVECYVKQSLLRDLSLYRRDLYGGRVHTNYFHEHFGVVDSHVEESAENQEKQFTQLDDRWSCKLNLGWNVSYGTFGLFGSLQEELAWIRQSRDARKVRTPRLTLASPSAERPIRLSAVMSTTKYVRRTVAFQRERAIALLRAKGCGDIVTESLPYDDYMRTLRQSRLALSCFGNGEICYRENEAWIAGATLLMPDMSHLEAYPALYVENETYVPLAWDLTDLEEKLEWIVSRENLSRDIAAAGQARRAAMFSAEGIAAFATRFAGLVTSCQGGLSSGPLHRRTAGSSRF